MKKYLLAILSITVLAGCGGDEAPKPPTAATLVFPENNSECTTGESLNATQSRVTFSWNASENTDSYQLTVTRLSNNSSQNFTTTATSFAVTLEKGVAYSYSVLSLSEDVPEEPALSQTFRFYNAGDGIENYAPFPATIISPTSGQTVNAPGGNLQLSWQGNDIENNIVNYEVYLGTTTNPTFVANTNTATTHTANGLMPGTVYYWRIITVDSDGNSSESELYEFKTN